MDTKVSFENWLGAFMAVLGLGGCGGATDVGHTGNNRDADGGPENTFPCDDPQPLRDALGAASGIEVCADGSLHRLDTRTCASVLPRPEACTPAASVTYSTCTNDGDCAERPNGYCELGIDGSCLCQYGCVTDGDCGPNYLCVCDAVAGHCVWAGCATDGDCDDELECRSYEATNSLCGDILFECQSARDECGVSDDCAETAPGAHCIADDSGVHRCSTSFSCAIPGRPFVVGDVAIHADPVARSDWMDPRTNASRRSVERIDPVVLDALTCHWTQAALIEHASIAAFARFVLQLVSVGAPADLIEAAQRAMRDETEHARLCFGLASRYGARSIGPSSLRVAGCLHEDSLTAMTRSTVREGCIGEMVAAIESGEALAHAQEAEVRRVLARITADEARHAELAFRFVEWALERDPGLASVVLDEFRRSEAVHSAGVTGGDDGPNAALLTAHGVMPRTHAAAIRARTLREVVRPLLERLINGSTPRLVA